MYKDKNDSDHTEFSLSNDFPIGKITEISLMNLAKVPLRYSSNSASISGALAESECNKSEDEEKSSEILNKVQRKEDPSSYKPRIRSFRALNRILNKFNFCETVELSTASSSQCSTSS